MCPRFPSLDGWMKEERERERERKRERQLAFWEEEPVHILAILESVIHAPMFLIETFYSLCSSNVLAWLSPARGFMVVLADDGAACV